MAKYATQMDAAKQGILTPEMETVAKEEHLAPELIRERVAKGTICIPANINHKRLHPYGIGEGLRTKMNVNLGISGDCHDYTAEFEKVKLAIQFQCEAIMDLSNYGKTHTFRKQLIEMSPAMIGTVPMYDAIGYLEKDLADIKATDFLKVLEAHAKEGVDFQTIHAGINRRAVEALKRQKRTTNIVSRGGSLLFAWMEMTGNENPFYEYYDDVLDILRKYDVTISLGDALRPGCNADSTDAGQISELGELGALTKRAWERDEQVMVEGPGHMTMDEIAANMKLQKRLCYGAPFYVLGPLVTDVAPGYDHITAAIGGAIHHIGNIHKYARPEDVPEHTMFVITTDGMENASRRYDSEKVKQMIERQKPKYGWEFLFLAAKIDAVETASQIGIGADRAVNYQCDSEGTALNYEVVSEAISSVRCSAPLNADWKKRIDEDYIKRGGI